MKTNVNVLEVKKLGEFQHGENALVTLNSDETNELYLEYYKQEVFDYFNINSREQVFSLKHFSSDAVSNMPQDLFEVSVNVIYKPEF